MSSTTSRVSLYKPAGGENVNVTTDLNDNLDKIDANLNFRVAANATARNAISPFWAGMNVRDTDTGKLWVSNGSAPISGSWKEIPVEGSTFGADLDIVAGKQVNVGATSSTAAFAASMAASGDDYATSRVSGDTQSRYLIKADGKTWWGPGGSTAVDTNLYRDSANVLATDDEFMIKGGNLILTSGGTAEKNAVPSASTTVANTTTETIIATYNIPANDATTGATYKITAWGTGAVVAASTPTMTFRFRFGGIAGTQMATTNAITFNSGVSGAKPWKVEIYLTCLTTGVSGTWFANLDATETFTITGGVPATSVGKRMDGITASTLDTTVSRDAVITAAWSVANASNSLICRGFTAERVS